MTLPGLLLQGRRICVASIISNPFVRAGPTLSLVTDIELNPLCLTNSTEAHTIV